MPDLSHPSEAVQHQAASALASGLHQGGWPQAEATAFANALIKVIADKAARSGQTPGIEPFTDADVKRTFDLAFPGWEKLPEAPTPPKARS